MPVEAGLCDRVRAHCAEVAAAARQVSIDLDRIGAVEPADPPRLDPAEHLLEGPAEEIARFTLMRDAINFGSGWFPTLDKRHGLSGTRSISVALVEHGGLGAEQMRAIDAAGIAAILGQDPGHELMALYARALNELGHFLGDRSSMDVIAAADGSAERLASQLAEAMPMWDDTGFYKRAQIAASDLSLAGVAEFGDLDRLTIFADNLVPHVLRVDGVLVLDPELEARIDAGELLEPGGAETELRACAVHACTAIAAELGTDERTLDMWLWNRGQGPRYKAIARPRCRTIAY